MSRNTVAFLLAAAMTCATGCSNRGDSNTSAALPAPTVRDSAGVRIVEHTIDFEAAQVRQEGGIGSQAILTLSGTPRLVIDSVPRSSDSQLHGVSGAVFLDSGLLAVAHRSTAELLVLDSLGGLRNTIGKRGSGPGEFRTIEGPWRLSGGRIAAYDGAQRRVTVFAQDGTLLWNTTATGEVIPDSAQRIWRSFGVTTDGTLLLWVDGTAKSENGMDRPPMWLVSLDSSGANRVVEGPRPGLERYVMRPTADGAYSLGLSPFAASPLAAPCGEQFIIADNQSYAVDLRSLAGRTLLSIRAPLTPRLADSADYAAAIRVQFPSGDISAASIAPLRHMTPSGSVPALRAVQCDEAGNIWLEEPAHDNGQWRRIISYASDGARRFTAFIPAASRTLAISVGAIAILAFDDDGRERVEVYAIPR